MSAKSQEPKILLLFDIDGTLTYPRKTIGSDISKIIEELRQKYYIGVVGGSDLSKQIEQLGSTALQDFDYNFAENGLIGYKNGKEMYKKSFKDFLGEEKLQKLINFCLKYISELNIPIKRGTFIEFRTGMLNISPIGRNCSQEERNEFNLYDNRYKVREKFVKVLEERFKDYGLKFSIGGQISFDVFPKGWDKTYCLQHVLPENFTEIHFFGDKTNPGENDYEIYVSDKTIGHKVADPEETISILKEKFL